MKVCECSDCGQQFESELEEPYCPICGSGDIIIYGDDENE